MERTEEMGVVGRRKMDRLRRAGLRPHQAADGTAATVGPALNQAANQVAMQFAGWIAG